MKCRFDLRVIVIVFLLIITIINLDTQSVYAIDWSPDMRITWDAQKDWHPSINQTRDGRIWVVWHSLRINNDAEIFYKVYDPSQVHPWSPDTRLTNTTGIDELPSIMQALDDRIWVVWVTNRTGNFQVYYKIYNGISWSSETQLPILPESNIHNMQFPSILQAADGTIWVFFSSRRTGNREIFYKTSNDNGASWSDDTLLTAISSPADDDWDPIATQAADGKIWLAWTKNDDIYYTFYNGVTWLPGAPVTTSSSFDTHPSIAQAADGKIWFLWDSDRSSDQYDIYYNIYDETTNAWSGDTPLTTDLGGDFMPSATRASDGNMWVTWASDRLSTDIYYKTTSLPASHDVTIFSVSPFKSVVTQGKTVSIEVVAQNHGTNTETFSISLYADTTLIGTKQVIDLVPGNLYPTYFDWNTSGAPLGNYTLKAEASIVLGETNTADNTYIDGELWVVIHDVAVTSITLNVRLAYQGYSYFRVIYVEVKNKGTLSEEVTVTTTSDPIIIGIQTVTIDAGANVTLMFFFNTFSLPYGYYNIVAEADPVPEETNQTDNYLSDGAVMVTVPGDIDGNRIVDILDWSILSAHWYPGPPMGPLGYDLTADIDEDGETNVLDLGIMSSNWEASW